MAPKLKFLERVCVPSFIPESRRKHWSHSEITFDVPNPLMSAYFKAQLTLELSVKDLETYLQRTGQIEVTPYV